MKTNHIASLDGLRGVAAIMVVLYHGRYWLPGGPLFQSGYLAVDFFFCLSGFVISYAYDTRLQQGMTAWAFFRARLVRLYPMIAIGTALAALIFAYQNHIANVPPVQTLYAILLPFAVLPNFFPGGPHTELFPVNGPLWSLFFEIAINMTYAILFCFLTTRIIAVLEIGLFLWLCIAAERHGLPFLGRYSDTFIGGIPRTGFSFFAGVLIFRAFAAEKLPKIPISVPVLATILVLFLTIDWAFIGALQVDIFCVAVLFPLVVIAACQQKLSRWQLKCAVTLGAISYPIYATHEPILIMLQHVFWHTPADVGSANLAVSILFIVLINWLFLRFYDKPLRSYLAPSKGIIIAA
jgi:peptidoglycan/LPS O-acetylase OafA/YrhL